MKSLSKYKEVWKNQDSEHINYSYNDIQNMLHKKSSSIVKWIFYISILEFCFWIFLSFFIDSDWDNNLIKNELNLLTTVLNTVNYVVIIIFIILFYRNYKLISVASNTQKLMQDILKTRKTVYYYVVYNVGMLVFSFTIILYFIFSSSDFLNKLQAARPNASLSSNLSIAVIISVIVISVIVGILLLFYRLIYGILLKKLKTNYEELTKS